MIRHLFRTLLGVPLPSVSGVVAAVAALKPQPLVSLDDHDRVRGALYQTAPSHSSGPRRNGIACPGCGAELFDAEPHVVLPAHPPKKRVFCHQCRFAGVRVA